MLIIFTGLSSCDPFISTLTTLSNEFSSPPPMESFCVALRLLDVWPALDCGQPTRDHAVKNGWHCYPSNYQLPIASQLSSLLLYVNWLQVLNFTFVEIVCCTCCVGMSQSSILVREMFIFLKIFIVIISVCVCKSEDNFMELISSFLLYVDLRGVNSDH